MKKAIIAFDIDGTLRCNCTDTCRDVNARVLEMAICFGSLKNSKLIAWSGGGAQYAQSFIDSNDTLMRLFGKRCYSKLNYYIKHGQVEIAVDDIQDTALGKVNLIVREK